ncbi:hypothetical protein [Streptomyces sp. NPDC093990]
MLRQISRSASCAGQPATALLSDRAWYVIGAVLRVDDGGRA